MHVVAVKLDERQIVDSLEAEYLIEISDGSAKVVFLKADGAFRLIVYQNRHRRVNAGKHRKASVAPQL